MNFAKHMRGVDMQRVMSLPGEMVDSVKGKASSMKEAWETYEQAAEPYLQALDMDTDKGQAALTNKAKTVIVGVVLGFVVLIIIGNLAPTAFDEFNGTTTDEGTTLVDVPGGELLESTGFLIFMVALLIIVLVFAFDLV